MRQLRGHMFTVALITLMLHAGVVTLGALRVCWAGEHRHAGLAADDCPMHHHAVTSPSMQHVHHGHDGAAPRPDGDKRLACGCSSDPTSPYIGLTGFIAPVAVLSQPLESSLVAFARDKSIADNHIPPHSPPPRSSVFSLS